MSISDLVSRLRGAPKAPVQKVPVTPLEKAHAGIDAYLTGGRPGNLRELLKSCYANGPMERSEDGPMHRLMLDAARGNRAARNLVMALTPEFAEFVEEEFEAAEKKLLERNEYVADGYAKELRASIPAKVSSHVAAEEQPVATMTEATATSASSTVASDTDDWAAQDKVLAPGRSNTLADLDHDAPEDFDDLAWEQQQIRQQQTEAVAAEEPIEPEIDEAAWEKQQLEQHIKSQERQHIAEELEVSRAAALRNLEAPTPEDLEQLLRRASYIGEGEYAALRGEEAQKELFKHLPSFAASYKEARPILSEWLPRLEAAEASNPEEYSAAAAHNFSKILAKAVVESRIGTVLSTRGAPTAAEQRLQQQSAPMMR